MKRFFIIIAVVLTLLPSVVKASTDTIIQGTTDFLLERAKENNFYIFEQRLKDNNEFKKFFPQTYSYIADGDLKVLLSSKNIWEKAVQNDLATFVTRTFAQSVTKQIDLAKLAGDGMEQYLKYAQILSVEINGSPQPINTMPINANQQTRDLINGFWDQPVAVRQELVALNDLLKKYSVIESVTPTSISDLKAQAQKSIDVFTHLDRLLRHYETNKGKLRINTDGFKAACTTDPALFFCKRADAPIIEHVELFQGEITALSATVLASSKKLAVFLDDRLREESDAKADPKKKATITENVIAAIRLLKEIGADKDINLDKLKHQILFFARLADATSSKEVKAILSEYTLPAVSFSIKRQNRVAHVLLSSYLGFGYGTTFDTNNDGKKDRSGIIAPIGLEWSYGLPSGDSLGVMVSPIDLGYPVTLKINGIKEKLSFSDIFTPGAYLSYGVRKLPLAFGLAYQRGRQIEGSKDVENKVLFFISYDMPLFTLY